MSAIADIKERYEKIYILADEDTHKLIKTMKEDILFLLTIAETTVEDVIGVQQVVANDIIDLIIQRYNMEVVDESQSH